jgi:hypothetical protein
MVEEPIYIWVYYHRLGAKLIYNFSVGFVSPPLPETYLIRKIRVPKLYVQIIQSHLKKSKFRELGLIECIVLNQQYSEVTLSVNEPLKYFADNSFNLAKNTGLGSYLLLITGAHLKSNKFKLIKSFDALSRSGEAQLKKAGLTRTEEHSLTSWQRGIAKNVRFARKRLV